MKKIVSILLCLQFVAVFAQQEEDREKIINEANQFVASGNKMLVQDEDFPQAEGEYRKAISKNPVDPTAKYNLANAYYGSKKYDEANLRYSEAAKTATDKMKKHKAFHNKGNTFMEQKKYKEAVEAYKNALRNNPKDDETRYNLALAKKMLEQQQQQNDQNQDDQNQDKDQNKDQNQDKKDGEDDKKDNKEGEDEKDKKGDDGDQKDKDQGEDQKDEGGEGDDKKDEEGKPKDDQGDKGEDQKDQGKNGEGQPQNQEPQRAKGQLSPERVRSILEAMNNQEKKVQDKINARKAQGRKTRTEKDW
ncbi:tetratricopeptide repeat protein [Aquimarina algicola]|uniref:Tetratricopeptide repeat protein n=1 Tax=Aquimarina algicola TaxID=2589995 RepID=A0A504JBU2_9FLAO|nr:tetratricopeptide repeat protein [Aquimarina algicola]TPN84060.1 tetratricopeptide repeat protein [Aquimarina algicola]